MQNGLFKPIRFYMRMALKPENNSLNTSALLRKTRKTNADTFCDYLEIWRASNGTSWRCTACSSHYLHGQMYMN